jgi:hypothetical protein
MRLVFNTYKLILDNINEQKQYSILKFIDYSFFEINMGAKGWFKIYFFCL